MALRRVDELTHELEAACRESQDWAALVAGVQERVTVAMWELAMAQAHLTEVKAKVGEC